jgi:hypothetical protein
MNKALIGIGGFIIGAAAGAFASFMYLSKKFDKDLEERTASIKATYEKLSGVKTEEETEKTEETEEKNDDDGEEDSSYEHLKKTAAVFHDTDGIDPETGTHYTKEELQYLRMLKEEEYSDDDDELPDTERPKMDPHGDPIDEDTGLPLGVENLDAYDRYMELLTSYEGTEDIYLITQEDFDNNSFGHTQKTYVIYDQSEDGEMHVMEEDGDEVEANKWHDELGYQEGVLDFDLFDAYDDHNIYIRNDQIATDFEVHLSDLTWFPDVHCISGLK